MGTINRKRKLEITAEDMPKRTYARTSTYRRRRRYYPKNRIAVRGPSKELNPTHTFTWLGNAGSFATTGIGNKHGVLQMDMTVLLPNCQGFLKLRELYTLYRIKKILVYLIASDTPDNAATQFTAAYQYNPLAVYPAVNDSDNQMEGANSNVKVFAADKEAVFRCRFNALRSLYSGLIASGYEVPQRMGFLSTGGYLGSNLADIHAGRIVVAHPATNITGALFRIRIEITAQFAGPNWNA